MSTNYYLKYNICECCNRFDKIHIGKSSAGWQFVFRGHGEDFMPVLQTYDQWMDFIENQLYEETAKIVNEYGKEIEYQEFINMVKEKQENPKNKVHNFTAYNYIDVRGYNFCSTQFS